MKYIILFLFIPFIFFAQEKHLQITNINNGETFVIKENKRLKIKTMNGEKLFGKLKFVDDNTILIDEKSLKIDEIKFIRKRSLSTTIIATSFIIVGAFTLGLAPILVIGDTQAALTAFLSSVGISSFAILLPNLSEKYSNSTYDFQIIELTN